MNRSPHNRSGLEHPLVWLAVVLGTLVVLYFLNLIWWLSLPLLLSVVFYFVCAPFVDHIKARGLSHGQALAVFFAAASALVLLMLLVLLPWLTTQIYKLQESVPEVMATLNSMLHRGAVEMEGRFPWLAESDFAERTRDKIDAFWEGLVTDHLQNIVIYLLSWIPSLLLVPYLAFFMMKDGAHCKRLIMRGIPNAFFEKVLMLFHRMNHQIKAYFCGLMGMTFLDTVTLAAGLWLIGLPYGIFPMGQALLLGLLAAVLAWIPYAGSVLGCSVIVLVCMTAAPGQFLLIVAAVVLFIAVRLIDDFLYTPLTIGRSMSVHPLLTVLVIFCGGMFAGVAGLLLAMPILGVAMVLGDVFGQVWFDHRLRARYEWAGKLRRMEARRGFDPASSA